MPKYRSIFDLRRRKKPFGLPDHSAETAEELAAAPAQTASETPVETDIEENQRSIQIDWGHCDDLQMRWIHSAGVRVLIAWIRPLVGKDLAQVGILAPLAANVYPIRTIEQLEDVIEAASVKRISTLSAVNHAIANGHMVLFTDGLPEALAVDANNFQARQIDKPELEPGVLGPQTAYVEGLDKNLGLLRTILRTPRMKIEFLMVGKISRTQVAVVYIQGIVKPKLVEEARQRLAKVDVDGVLDINILREMINDAPLSPYPVDQITERPDRTVAGLLQARIAILVDGSPYAMLVPATFINHLQSNEDYYESFLVSSMFRLLRHMTYWVSLILPALYVAVLTFHHEMLPTRLLITLAATYEGIPFPAVVEALLMLVTFETLREAGVRLPKAVGQSVSIVGALVIGEAAVNAGIVSPGMVIIVALTGVSSFTIPSFHLAMTNRLLQFVFVLAAGTFGLLGITVCLYLLLTHLVSIRSFGVPYFAPLAPVGWKSLGRDVVIRAPWWRMRERPEMMEPMDSVRERTARPGPGRSRK